MPDDVFARIARWWDRDASTREKQALLALANLEASLATAWWEDLPGNARFVIVSSARGLIRLGDELVKVIAR
jgi:hypothetical protein